MLQLFVQCLFLSVMLSNQCVYAEDMAELKEKYAKILMSCAQDNPISPGDIEQLKNSKMPDSDNVKCLFACAYKTTGMMDDQGKLSVEGVNKLAQTFLADDPEQLKKAEQFTDACKSVNDEEVTDGDKGCERAALLFKCSIEKAPQFDFAM